MDRLTDKEIKCMAEFCEAKNCVNYERNGCCGYERYQRLAAYEDTGLTPEEIKTLGEKLKRSAVAIIEESKHQERMLKMLELERAEAEGRLIVLPCKVGDAVWMLVDEFDGKTLVPKAKPRVIDGIGGNSLNMVWMVSKNPFELRFHPSEFGKTVFLTREEAEAALKGEKDEE